MAQENFYSDFVKNIQELLISGKSEEALSIVKNNKYNTEVNNHLWDIIPVFTQFLNSDQENVNSKRFRCCEKFVNIIAENAPPEEVLLQFIEEIEEAEDDIKFFLMLKPIQKVILRISEKRINSISWCFNSIYTYLNKSEIPENENLIGKEKLLLDTHKEVQKINKQYEEILIFFDNFTQALKDTVVENTENQMLIIQKFLIQLLGKPFVYLDMETFDGVKSKARITAEKIVDKIFSINYNPLSIVVMCNDSEYSELFKPDEAGLAVLFYLVYSEGVLNERVPKVYSPFYFFQTSLHLVTTLLEIDHQIVIEKGLHLAKTLLKHTNKHKLSYLMLDSAAHSKFCKALTKIIVYNQGELTRKAGLDCYKNYLLAFETRGFYLLIYNLLPILNHSGLIGFTITLYKEALATEFSKNPTDISPYFKGTKQYNLIMKFCHLNQKEASDLIELSDQLISSLNLLRYLILRDKGNMTGIWDHISEIGKTFLEPLRKGLDLSRAHYELRVKEVQDETASGDTKTKVSVSVGGENLENMPRQEKLKVLNMSLNAFDVIESLLSRLNECIELNR